MKNIKIGSIIVIADSRTKSRLYSAVITNFHPNYPDEVFLKFLGNRHFGDSTCQYSLTWCPIVRVIKY